MSVVRVLLVEDDEDDVALAQEMLSDVPGTRYDLHWISERDEAVRLLRAGEHDVCLLDWRMRGWDGIELLESVGTSFAMPVILLTGLRDASVDRRALAAGASDYLSKDQMVPSLLERSIRYAIERHRAAAERERLKTHLRFSERMSSLGRLAAGVAHEINNPLSYIVTNVEFALEYVQALPPSQRGDLEAALRDAREGAERVQQITRSLHAMTRREVEEPQTVDLHHAVESSIRIASTHLRERARLETELERVPPVRADETRIGQVVVNLLVNAAQAVAEAGGDDHVVRVRLFHAAPHAVIEVSDTGVGIPDDLRERIFEPFFSTKDVGSGSGLGLAICHGIVNACGGRIEVETRPGRGSTFRVRLPTSAELPRDETSAPTRRRTRARILLVDDDPLVARAIGRALSSHEVVSFHDSHEALAALRQQCFDVVLCDLMMPRMTGMELYARLREHCAECAERVVFLTGGAFTPEARQFVEDVDRPCLDKPIDLAALEGLIAERLG